MLANEQVIDGACWRCGTIVEPRDLEQWFFRITAYADELLKGLETLTEWPEKVVVMQRNWIGRSEGARVKFPIAGERRSRSRSSRRASTPSTARPSSCSRPSIRWSSGSPPSVPDPRAFRAQRRGVPRAGSRGARPARSRRKASTPAARRSTRSPARTVPIWIANFVLAEYGTGAIMAVPAHDERDFEFARKYSLPITHRGPVGRHAGVGRRR